MCIKYEREKERTKEGKKERKKERRKERKKDRPENTLVVCTAKWIHNFKVTQKLYRQSSKFIDAAISLNKRGFFAEFSSTYFPTLIPFFLGYR